MRFYGQFAYGGGMKRVEFYKIVMNDGVYQLEEEQGQDGVVLDNDALSRWALLIYSCYQQQERLPLQFRRYLTAYYENGAVEYIALADANGLMHKSRLDGFATTWLEGEEENRVWLGADGAVENRGPSGMKVKWILNLLLHAISNDSMFVNPPIMDNTFGHM